MTTLTEHRAYCYLTLPHIAIWILACIVWLYCVRLHYAVVSHHFFFCLVCGLLEKKKKKRTVFKGDKPDRDQCLALYRMSERLGYHRAIPNLVLRAHFSLKKCLVTMGKKIGPSNNQCQLDCTYRLVL